MKIKFSNYLIRDLNKDDASSLAKYANNRKIWKNLRDLFPHPYGLSDAESFILSIESQAPKTVFAIASNDEAIGAIGLTFGKDVHRFNAELGYWIGEPFWNKGIMTKAVSRFTDYTFKHFNLKRIFAEPYATNEASKKVLEKSGFVFEGRLISSVNKDGSFLDQLLYARVDHGNR